MRLHMPQQTLISCIFVLIRLIALGDLTCRALPLLSDRTILEGRQQGFPLFFFMSFHCGLLHLTPRHLAVALSHAHCAGSSAVKETTA
jgi:hypothetical protein